MQISARTFSPNCVDPCSCHFLDAFQDAKRRTPDWRLVQDLAFCGPSCILPQGPRRQSCQYIIILIMWPVMRCFPSVSVNHGLLLPSVQGIRFCDILSNTWEENGFNFRGHMKIAQRNKPPFKMFILITKPLKCFTSIPSNPNHTASFRWTA